MCSPREANAETSVSLELRRKAAKSLQNLSNLLLPAARYHLALSTLAHEPRRSKGRALAFTFSPRTPSTMEPPAAPESPTTPTQLHSFPSLSISEPPASDAALGATHDPLEALSSSPLVQDSDDDSGSDEEEDSRAPPLRTNTLPPQLGALELPSPVFGRSFVDLLDFSPSSGTPSSTTPTITGLIPGPRPARQRTPSILGSLRSSLYASSYSAGPPSQHLREPTLNFSAPRTIKDERRRREGKEEDVWVGVFPGAEEECELGDGVDVSEWGVEEWEEVRAFVGDRGYAIDEQSSWVSLMDREQLGAEGGVAEC